MKQFGVLLRAGIASFAVFGIALTGGKWVASAEGTIPLPPSGPTTTTGWDQDSSELPEEVQQSLQSWFSYFANENPCAFFETHWGQVRVPLDNLEACQAAQGNVTVRCLTSDGTLTQDTVKNVGVSSDGSRLMLDIFTEQGGTCGVFVQPGAGSLSISPGIIAGGATTPAWNLNSYALSDDPLIASQLPSWFSAFSDYQPCGFFPVHWGAMAVSLAGSEACLANQGNLTVMCITGDGNLTQAGIQTGSVGVSADGMTLYAAYEAQQDGHCGIFQGPASTTVSPGVIQS